MTKSIALIFSVLSLGASQISLRELQQLEWPRENGSQVLGKTNEDSIDRQVEAPPSVVSSLCLVLNGAPSSWNVSHEEKWKTWYAAPFDQRSSDIVTISDAGGKSFVFLIKPDRWILLSNPRSLDQVSHVLADNCNPLVSLSESQWEAYALELAGLYQPGPHRAVLSMAFKNSSVSNAKEYLLQGTEKNQDVLWAFCSDPVIHLTGDTSSASFNMITTSGSVEQWNLLFKWGASIELKSVALKTLSPAGTFSYGVTD